MFDVLSKYGNETDAKNRAQKLREQYVGNNYSQHNPSTTVDLLVSMLEEKR